MNDGYIDGSEIVSKSSIMQVAQTQHMHLPSKHGERYVDWWCLQYDVEIDEGFAIAAARERFHDNLVPSKRNSSSACSGYFPNHVKSWSKCKSLAALNSNLN